MGDVGELVEVAALQEACASEDRRYGFHQAEKRLGESKLGEVVRHYRDLKARLDRIEARAVGSYHAYGSLGEVSRKLGELEQQRDEADELAEGDYSRLAILRDGTSSHHHYCIQRSAL